MSENRKGIPKRDGSGRGIRANKGRGGCKEPRESGKFRRFGLRGLRFRNPLV